MNLGDIKRFTCSKGVLRKQLTAIQFYRLRHTKEVHMNIICNDCKSLEIRNMHACMKQ